MTTQDFITKANQIGDREEEIDRLCLNWLRQKAGDIGVRDRKIALAALNIYEQATE